MSLLVVGLSHRSAPVSLLERAAVTGDQVAKLLRDMHSAEPVSEAILLSTCNRVEVYAEIDRFHAGVSAISGLIAQYAEVGLEELTKHLYVHYEDRAVQHMFSVACGLDSMVVGEGQILGQVREALKLAQAEETAGRTLNEVAQQALRVGKRAHTETRIDQAGADMVTVALSAAARQLGPLSGLRALVVGAGSMSALAANTLARGGVGEVAVANRTAERAERLAECLGSAYEGVTGRAVPFDAIGPALAEADLVISCTGAQGVVVGEPAVRAAMEGREAPLVILDLALPHDVDPAVAELPGVTLVDLSRLQVASADGEGQPVTADDVAAVQRIVSDEVTAYLGEKRKARVAPTVVALRARAAGVVEAELARLLGRLPDLDERTRAEVSQALRRTADKILHQPTVRVKELAGSPGGAGYETALRELFDLDPKAPEAVARVELPGEDEA